MTRIPVSIVTGFLGAGKTTFLNRLIATGALDRAALVINEFGDIGIDHLLIETAKEGVVELSGGCLCCSLRGDLADTLERLTERDPTPDRIVIETTGLADPGPIAQTVIAHPELNRRLELAGILALIDCADGPVLLDAHEEAQRQIAMADRILMTKADAKKPVTGLGDILRATNPTAQALDAACDELSVEWLDGAPSTRGFSASLPLFAENGRSEQKPGGGRVGGEVLGHDSNPSVGNRSAIRSSKAVSNPPEERGEENRHPHDHIRRTNIKAIALSVSDPVSFSAIELLLDRLLAICGDNLLRVKGLIRTTERLDRPLLIQGVGQSFDTPRHLPQWHDGEPVTRLIVIGRNLDEPKIRRLFEGLTGTPAPDTPDRQALEENPLSVPGFV